MTQEHHQSFTKNKSTMSNKLNPVLTWDFYYHLKQMIENGSKWEVLAAAAMRIYMTHEPYKDTDFRTDGIREEIEAYIANHERMARMAQTGDLTDCGTIISSVGDLYVDFTLMLCQVLQERDIELLNLVCEMANVLAPFSEKHYSVVDTELKFFEQQLRTTALLLQHIAPNAKDILLTYHFYPSVESK